MNRSYSTVRLAAILLLMSAVACACASSPPETVHYRLDIEPDRVDEQPSSGPMLALEPFTVDAAYDDAQIVYRRSKYRLDYYFYHRWASAPGLLITDALRRGYQRTGRFRSVSSGQVARSDVVLSGHVGALEEVDVSEEQWLGRVVIELRLRDTVTGTLLWSGVIEEQEPLVERSPAGLAEALSKAITRVVEQTAPKFARLAAQARPAKRAPTPRSIESSQP